MAPPISMATYTYVDLNIPEGALLADLNGVFVDLSSARELAETLKNEMAAERPNWQLVEPYSTAIAVRYSRPFVTGVRTRLGEEDLVVMTEAQRTAHERLRAYRDKHIAHSVNAFEDNQPRANYCLERVREEGITSIGCSHGRVAGLSSEHLDDVIELTTLMLRHVEARMSQEQARLLELVREMPLDVVLSGEQKAFVIDRNTRIDKARRK
jgi:hypothetical protein